MKYAGLNDVLKNINACVVVYCVDKNLQVNMEYFNDRFAELYGGDNTILQEAFRSDIAFGVAEEYKKSVRDMFFEMVKTGEKGEATYRAITDGNDEIWVNIKGTPVKRENDTLVYVTFFNITEQVKATENARRSEQYLQSACEFATIFTWVYEIDTKVIHPGKLLREQIGLPADMEDFPECIFALHMVCPEYEELYRTKIEEIEKGAKQVEFEVQAELPDGKKHWISYRFDIVEYENGKPKIAVGTAQYEDVNKRLEARYQHEQKKKIVEDSTMFGYVISNINTNTVIERKILHDKMQFSEKESCYETVANAFAETIVSEEERKKWKEIHSIKNMLAALNNGTTAIEVELNVLCQDGIMRWVREVMNLVQHPDTGEILLYNYFYNVHDQKIFEELMSALADYGYEVCGSLMADLDQISLVYAGRQSNQMVVGSYREMNGAYADNIMEEDRQMYLDTSSINHMKEETEDKDGYELIYRVVENGMLHYKKAQCYLYDRADQTYLILRSDVTSTMQKEAAKRKELEEALVEAKRANEAKSSFLSRMSHELRTPLNAMNGYTSLMEQSICEGEFDKEALLKNISATQHATEYLLTIISDILDIQKIEQERTILHKEKINVEAYMKNVVDMICKEAEEKHIAFSYERKTHFHNTYLLDGVRFQQVLLNILHNAVKFTPEKGSIWMTAEATGEEDTDTTLKIVIADTGIGMAQEFLEERLFQKFAQENQNITSPYDGCGTGLFLSRELIRLMGGEISCESEKGKGSRFTITLAATPVKEEERKRRKKEYVSYDLSGVHILLCEDNPMNQDMEKRIMERMNCVVDIADDGQIGINKFRESGEQEYDIVLMDIRMPNVDGMEATRRIRALDRNDAKQIPIFAVSANAFEEDVRMSLEAGMNEHIAKPIRPNVMYETIKRYLER